MIPCKYFEWRYCVPRIEGPYGTQYFRYSGLYPRWIKTKRGREIKCRKGERFDLENQIVARKQLERSPLDARISRIARRIRMIEWTVCIYIQHRRASISPTAAAVSINTHYAIREGKSRVNARSNVGTNRSDKGALTRARLGCGETNGERETESRDLIVPQASKTARRTNRSAIKSTGMQLKRSQRETTSSVYPVNSFRASSPSSANFSVRDDSFREPYVRQHSFSPIDSTAVDRIRSPKG